MRKVLIAAPWIPAAGVATYVFSRWNRLPARIAVTFFNGGPSRWRAETTHDSGDAGVDVRNIGAVHGAAADAREGSRGAFWLRRC
jgi:hypothetical protein